MGATRPELSEKNQYWVSKHRYYELKHFCLQYPEWCEQVKQIDGLPVMSPERRERINEGHSSDPTAAYASARVDLMSRITMVDQAAFEACEHQFWYSVLVRAVTEGLSYDVLEAQNGIMPVARGEWYELYRRFFWTLDKLRG